MTEVCTFHDAHDDDFEPAGPPCGRPAVRAVYWPTVNKVSPTCDIDHPIDALAPPHYFGELP